MKNITVLTMIVTFIAVVLFTGCQKREADNKGKPSTEHSGNDGHDHSNHSKDDGHGH
jgi:hypothetical protein